MRFSGFLASCAMLSFLTAALFAASSARATAPVQTAESGSIFDGKNWFDKVPSSATPAIEDAAQAKGEEASPPAAPVKTTAMPKPVESKPQVAAVVPVKALDACTAATPSRFAPLPVIAAHATGRRPMIAIIIDDVGPDHKRSLRAIDELPAQVTLSLLPYTHDIAALAEKARARGHQMIVHIPMQPERSTADPGPDYLGVTQTADDLRKRINRNLGAFTGYIGVNNHMGSQFTQYRPGLEILMHELKARGLMFLDSKTAPESVAEDVARENGLLTTHRDVFLDHFEDRAHVEEYLARTERVALKAGSVIAIGHPKDATLAALEQWLPTLQAKGFDLVPLGQVAAVRAAAHGGQGLHVSTAAASASAAKHQ
jgi:polysaccharide deacetylase 2 family uncharacterized protein YibQ